MHRLPRIQDEDRDANAGRLGASGEVVGQPELGRRIPMRREVRGGGWGGASNLLWLPRAGSLGEVWGTPLAGCRAPWTLRASTWPLASCRRGWRPLPAVRLLLIAPAPCACLACSPCPFAAWKERCTGHGNWPLLPGNFHRPLPTRSLPPPPLPASPQP